jgi:hypothetical protein
MTHKRIRFVLEMTVPEHFVLATTRYYVETKLKDVYPGRDIRLSEFNRVAAIEERRSHTKSATETPRQVLREIRQIIARTTGAHFREPGIKNRPRYTAEQRAEIKRSGTPLAVPFADREIAQDLGAIFDGDRKIWLAPSDSDLTEYQKRNWLPA